MTVDPLVLAQHYGKFHPYLADMAARFPLADREKQMRWLGFMQDVMWSEGLATIDDLRRHVTEGLREL